ncbi:MAG TPA: glycosyltransferase family 4 protein [Terriglobales bacterium]|nr:glycosyltransferase family 4 protein [Terriglobales bacterium]
MKVALIAPPMIAVPPADYGGTELFVAHLATSLQEMGIEVVVYANGESTVPVARRSLYEHAEWPIKNPEHGWIRDVNHTSWAIHDAESRCDILHVQSAPGLPFGRFSGRPMVLTLHGPHDPKLSELYSFFPDIHYVCISHAQCREEAMPRMHTVHHGIDIDQYRLVEHKQEYLSFIGRIAPLKGTHIAIDVAKRTGIPLKIAGDIQPLHRDYFEKKIKPHLDGKLVEYIGLADLATKNELLGNSRAMLFPIQWNEPFGLVMVEAMACGTPVLAMPGGSVPEIISPGISGYICRSVVAMAKHARDLSLNAAAVRKYVEENFSTARMAKAYLEVYRTALREKPKEKVA